MSRNERVKVFVRIRPTSKFAENNIELLPDGKSINIHFNKDQRRGYINNQILDWAFTQDRVFHNASQETVFEECARDILTSSLSGYNGTIMTYGQTGAGKTFTMTGSTERFEHRGLIPRAIQQLFREISENTETSVTVRVSYMEIYNECMYDLLSTLPGTVPVDPSLMSITEDSYNGFTTVKGLSIHTANNEEEALNYLFEGETNRIIAQHSLNKQSSRSHCIFTLYIESHSRVESNTKFTMSKLNLVDLAGSERLGKTNSEGDTQTEAVYINKSLTFLEQVVIALSDPHREHVPYRQSKLTHVLKDSLGGRCKMMLIANIWGEAEQLEETLSTLRFGSRMMMVPCAPAVMDCYDTNKLCKEYEKEIKLLRKELTMHDTLTNRSQISYEPLSYSQIEEVRDQVKRFLDGELNDIELINVRQIQETFTQFKSIVNSLEASVEEKLKEKYILQERAETAAGSVAKSGGKGEGDVGVVGEVDPKGFGVGVASGAVKPNVTAVNNNKRSKSRKSRDSAEPKSRAGRSAGREKPESPAPSETSDKRLPSPPPKDSAFEEFKKERGSEINRILNENKAILKSKRQSAKELSTTINRLKHEMDQESTSLNSKTEERLCDGQMTADNGQVVIGEDEFQHLKKLKDLKAQYRENFNELQNTKSEIAYCEKLVNQCRQRLLTEFDSWYTESFLGPDEKITSSVPGVRKVSQVGYVPEDEQEKFDQLQLELLMEHPDSVPYYNAKMQTERRIHLSSSIKKTKSKPGAVVATIRNKPPTTLTVT